VGAAGRLEAASLADVFSRSDNASTRVVDHAPWSALIERYRRLGPDGVALFAYAAVTHEDRAALAAYVEGLQAARVTELARPAQLAYWINLYNALTVKVILDNYPLASIRDISSGLFSSGPWGLDLVTVEGHDLSLDDIEHEILRPIWRDARIHYVVNCASIGCPNLAAVAFTAENAPALMDAGARDYINHPRGVRVEDGAIVASSLYDWYAGDFGTQLDLMAHFRRYAEPGLTAMLAGHTHVRAYSYDWALNEAR
jgi:hypothetical protein